MPHFEGDFVNPSYGNHTCHRYSDLMYLVRGEQLHRLLQPSPQAGRGWCSRLQTSLKKHSRDGAHGEGDKTESAS